MSEEFDLRYGHVFSLSYTRELNDFYRKNKLHILNSFEQLYSDINDFNLGLSPVLCRNSYSSDFLEDIVKITFLLSFEKHCQISLRCYDYQLKYIAKKCPEFKKRIKSIIIYKNPRKKIFKTLFVILYLNVKSILFLRKLNQLKISSEDLVESVIYDSDVENQEFADRHFPNYFNDIQYICRIYKVKSYRKLQSFLNCNNILVKESFFGIFDYLQILMNFVFSIFKLRKNNYNFNFLGYELSEIIYFHINRDSCSLSTYEGFKSLHFIKKNKNTLNKVNKFYFWFENQEHDHLVVKYLKDNQIFEHLIGYRGFHASCFCLNLFPTKYETINNYVPDRHFVISQSIKNEIQEYFDFDNIFVGKALRFSVINKLNNNLLLVGLPVNNNEISYILNLLSFLKPQDINNLKLVIKFHPASFIEKYNKFLKNISVDYEISQKPIEYLLSEAHVLLSSASSICIQAVLAGVSLGVIGKPGNIIQNPLPSDYIVRCTEIYSSDELLSFLKNPSIDKISELDLELLCDLKTDFK